MPIYCYIFYKQITNLLSNEISITNKFKMAAIVLNSTKNTLNKCNNGLFNNVFYMYHSNSRPKIIKIFL